MIKVPINNITTEINQIDVLEIKKAFPQIPTDCDVWVIKIFWTPLGVTRMSESTKSMLKDDIDQAIKSAMSAIPKGALVLHKWPTVGIVEEEVDVAIAMFLSKNDEHE